MVFALAGLVSGRKSRIEKATLSGHRRLAAEIEAPVILHICGNTADRIGTIAQTGVSCFHWDTKTGRPEEVRALAGPRLALMGGIGNFTLLRGTPEDVAAQVETAIAGDIDVIGPECAVPLSTPLANLKAITAGRYRSLGQSR